MIPSDNFIIISRKEDFFMQINEGTLDLTDRVDLTNTNLFNIPPNTISLNLTRCRKLTDLFFEKLPKNLQHLTLRHLTLVTGKNFNRLPKQLKTLDLTGCYNFEGRYIKLIPRALLKLHIEGCPKVSDEHVIDLPPKLTDFTYSHKCPYFAPCGNITLTALANLPNTIRSVTIKRCALHNTQYPKTFPSGVVKSVNSSPSTNPKGRNSPQDFS